MTITTRELVKHGETLCFEKIARYKQGLSMGKDETGLENSVSLLAAGRRKAELGGPARPSEPPLRKLYVYRCWESPQSAQQQEMLNRAGHLLVKLLNSGHLAMRKVSQRKKNKYEAKRTKGKKPNNNKPSLFRKSLLQLSMVRENGSLREDKVMSEH